MLKRPKRKGRNKAIVCCAQFSKIAKGSFKNGRDQSPDTSAMPSGRPIKCEMTAHSKHVDIASRTWLKNAARNLRSLCILIFANKLVWANSKSSESSFPTIVTSRRYARAIVHPAHLAQPEGSPEGLTFLILQDEDELRNVQHESWKCYWLDVLMCVGYMVGRLRSRCFVDQAPHGAMDAELLR